MANPRAPGPSVAITKFAFQWLGSVICFVVIAIVVVTVFGYR